MDAQRGLWRALRPARTEFRPRLANCRESTAPCRPATLPRHATQVLGWQPVSCRKSPAAQTPRAHHWPLPARWDNRRKASINCGGGSESLSGHLRRRLALRAPRSAAQALAKPPQLVRGCLLDLPPVGLPLLPQPGGQVALAGSHARTTLQRGDDVGAVAGLLRPGAGRVVGPAPAVFVVERVAQRAEGLLPARWRDVQALARLQVDIVTLVSSGARDPAHYEVESRFRSVELDLDDRRFEAHLGKVQPSFFDR